MAKPARLTTEEISQAFSGSNQFSPILTPEQCALLLGVQLRTLKQYVAEGKLDGATFKIGKHRRFWRDRVIQTCFNRNLPRNHYGAEGD